MKSVLPLQKLLSKSSMEEREHFLRVVFYLQMFTK